MTEATIFRTWAESLPKTVEVCSIELPGRGTQMKSAPFLRLKPLVGAIAQALTRNQFAPALLPHLNKPFAFFGHSMGAVVSFELARLLRKQYGLEPVHMFPAAYNDNQLIREGESRAMLGSPHLSILSFSFIKI